MSDDSNMPAGGRDDLPLTPRQLEIFHLIAKGLSNREICEILGISNNTVKIHVAAILRSLNVSNRTEAVYIYRELLADGATDKASGQSKQMQILDRIGRPALAVLPFEDLSDGNADDHLVEGLIEDLLVNLSAWRWFPIVSYGSSRKFSEADQSIQEIGAALGAGYLITGSIRRSGSKVRVTVKLIEAGSGEMPWSNTFDTQVGDLFDMQDEIATHIVRRLAPELLEDQARRLNERSAVEFGTWEFGCKGFWHLNRGNKEDALRALDCFDAALQQNPESGFAMNGRVCTSQKLLYEQWTDEPANTVGSIIQDAELCLRFDARASYSHANMGLAAILQGRREAALEHLEFAVDLNPNSTRALSLLAQAYGMSGKVDEAIIYLEDLLRIDKHSPSAYSYRNVLAMCHFVLGHHEEAIDWARSAIALQPSVSGAYLSLTAALTELGRSDDARVVVDELYRQAPDFELSQRLAMMRPFTEPSLLAKLTSALSKAGITE